MYINHRKANTMSIGKIMLSIAAGAAAGAALGLLFAPANGELTRKKIARRGAGYAEDAKERFGEYIDLFTDRYESIKEGAVDLANSVRE
jgi:gas vesicle protein